MATVTRRSPIALAVLALLYEEPMHPYRMQYLIKQRGKEEVINVRQRASLYQTIDRLARAGLIRVRETVRDERWPERTIYELTHEGSETLGRWLREMLSDPAQEYPEFPAALSFLALLSPEEALRQLERRVTRLETELRRLEEELAAGAQVVPRLFLLESEFLRAKIQAELAWVDGVAGELRAGHITWSEAWLHEVAERMEAQDGGSEDSQKGSAA